MNIVKALAVGYVLGILFAPDRGTKTRKKLADIFSNYKDEAKDYALDVADKVESRIESAKKAIKKV
jgi:gas vesicle protein